MFGDSNHPAIVELSPYLENSFGDGTRIDYGSGHELAFIAFLSCLDLIGFIQPTDYQAIVTRVFTKYLEMVRKLQTVYNLEPAGSHGMILDLILRCLGT